MLIDHYLYFKINYLFRFVGLNINDEVICGLQTYYIIYSRFAIVVLFLFCEKRIFFSRNCPKELFA